MTIFAGLSMFANVALFALAATGVWIAGSALAGYADAIADRTRIARATMGLVFLATATELPEIATTFTAAVAGHAQLVLNNMFGGIVLQTAILAIADVFIVRGALTSYPRKATHALEAALLIVLLSLLLAICLFGDVSTGFHFGFGTAFLAAAYVVCIFLVRAYDAQGDWVPLEMPDPEPGASSGTASESLRQLTMKGLAIRSAVAVMTILVCGVLLVGTADAIAGQTGLGSSFVGVTFLAAATSLPELSTTFAAVRLGAYTMAISNIFGSNLIMLALLFPADVLYRPGSLLATAGKSELIALVAGLLVTAVYVVGLLVRRKRLVFGMGADSACVLAIYFASLVVFFVSR